MNFFDCLTHAAQHAQDWDMPAELLPLIIAGEANLLSGHEAGHMSLAAWD